MDDITQYKEALSKLSDLIYLIQKDISGVRLRSSLVLRKKEFTEQINQVIELLNRDIETVANNIKKIKKWLNIRRNTLNSIKNLYSVIENTINDSKNVKEIKDRLRMFGKSAHEEFLLNILYLEDLWKEIEDTMNSMQKVASIMKVTHEKIERYEQEFNLEPDNLISSIDILFNYLIEGKFEEFDSLETKIRETILPKYEK